MLSTDWGKSADGPRSLCSGTTLALKGAQILGNFVSDPLELSLELASNVL